MSSFNNSGSLSEADSELFAAEKKKLETIIEAWIKANSHLMLTDVTYERDQTGLSAFITCQPVIPTGDEAQQLRFHFRKVVNLK